MREIKFRGKRLDNGEWVYGYYWSNDLGNHFIKVTKDENGFCLYDVEVDPATVGQCTGLGDKKNTNIWEEDIVIVSNKYFKIKDEKHKIIFKDGSFGVQYGCSLDFFKSLSAWDDCEVIGNIHDNPEEVPNGT